MFSPLLGTWRRWSDDPPPAGALLKFEYACTGQRVVCRPEDIPEHWQRSRVLWKKVGIQREQEWRNEHGRG